MILPRASTRLNPALNTLSLNLNRQDALPVMPYQQCHRTEGIVIWDEWKKK